MPTHTNPLRYAETRNPKLKKTNTTPDTLFWPILPVFISLHPSDVSLFYQSFQAIQRNLILAVLGFKYTMVRLSKSVKSVVPKVFICLRLLLANPFHTLPPAQPLPAPENFEFP